MISFIRYFTNIRLVRRGIIKHIDNIYSSRLIPSLKTSSSLSSFPAYVLFASTLLLLTFSFSSDDAFGDHLTGETKWQLVMISNEPACSNYHYQLMQKYDDVTEKYFELYQFENSKYEPLCFPKTKYLSEYNNPEDLDLQIIVLDRNLGEQELHSQKMGGIYTHTGINQMKNHLIIFCGDCSNFYYSDPVWILTHELSHFVLYYLDYDLSIVEDLIHVNDDAYDKCREHYSESCNSIVARLRVDTVAYSYTVMPPYEPAIGGKLIDNTNEVSPNLLELTKVITKWWTAGKISEGDFANALGFIADGNSILSDKDNEILLADGPLDDEQKWYEVAPYVKEEKKSEILSALPIDLESNEEKISTQEIVLGLPEWFKTTANWWTQDKITNDEIIKSIEYLHQTGIIRPR